VAVEDQTKGQDRHWSRHAQHYDDVFLDPFAPGVENPLHARLAAVTDPAEKSVIDLGCGTGPLLPYLLGRFGSVTALDFAPGMIARARERLGPDAERVRFERRPMHELDDLGGPFDLAVAVNSLVMPEIAAIERTLKAVRGALRPGGLFLGVVPAIDALYYQTMLLLDRALASGLGPRAAEKQAAEQAEHPLYDFAFGRFRFQGLKQKFWQPFEIRHRLRAAGFAQVELEQVLYPWDESLPGGPDFADHPRSWDWLFAARP